MDEIETMKVGAVAEAAGLTVRTLHHWDSIGLLSPSERSPAGHRGYTEADLVRLYQVLALRSLGLGLDSIAVCLDAGVDPARLVRDHLAEVRAAWADDPAGLAGVPAEQAAAWRALAQYLDLARRSTHTKDQEHA